ncbi:hypothetical protein HHK36_032124 [Tetracentron sinense]|uniref:Clp ATPase C-terminal domain-containing protein n=1 Tax=Tetracentron sinense TaxID=13715 RepID=A0A834Y611_TETSI|nr:hypothetical protein HHK36_032124 [Tetracentron sinense]
MKKFCSTERLLDLKQIAEVVSRWTGIPSQGLDQDNEKERLIGLAEMCCTRELWDKTKRLMLCRGCVEDMKKVGAAHRGGERRRPYSVVLFDERLTGKCSMQSAREKVMHEVKRHFMPELLNRMDEIVVFDPLSREQLEKVARLQMTDVNVRLAKRGIALAVSDAALGLVLEESYDPVYGARPIRRWMEKNVVTELSKMVIKEEINENSVVYIDAEPGGKMLEYRVEKKEGLVNAATGEKSDILIQKPDGLWSDAVVEIIEIED